MSSCRLRGRAPLLLLSLLLIAGCGGGEEAAPPGLPPSVSPVDPATAGRIDGRVTFSGTVPPAPPVRMPSDPNCERLGGDPTTGVVIVHDDGLQNVFVYVKDGLGDLRFPVPSAPVILDQRGCHYVPHVLGVQVGQPLEIVNSDPTLHNVHAIPETNQEFNMGQPVAGMRQTHLFTEPEVMIRVRCDVHNWMQAWVGVLDHPFFAVSDENGRVELRGLPPGTYTIEAWHERLGTRTATVTVEAGGAASATFAFEA